MNIHEYQAQQLFEAFGISVPQGTLLESVGSVDATIDALPYDHICIKSQIHSGGRGKGIFKKDIGCGGVVVAHSKEEAKSLAKKMLGNTLMTKQTGEQGKVVHRLYLVPILSFKHEFYVAITLDRQLRQPVIIASSAGGMEIENIAAEDPSKILKVPIDPLLGLRTYQANSVAYRLGLSKDAAKAFSQLLMHLYALFCQKDVSLAEINPLVLTDDDHLVALDSKIQFDDNALARHPDIASLKDSQEQDPKEVEADKYNLNYIALDGNIACMVNGAGLAMATMDIIKYYGGSPANFLDVGGGANEEQITHAFEIILSDPHIRGILVNIFGGIVKCDVVANGIIHAAQHTQLNVPLVVRLEGTNVELGKKILQESGLKISPADNLDDAAKKIIELAK